MNAKELIEQLQGHTIVAQSDPESIFSYYFVAWNGSCTYRIFHINYSDNLIDEVDVWVSDTDNINRSEYAQKYLNGWMIRYNNSSHY